MKYNNQKGHDHSHEAKVTHEHVKQSWTSRMNSKHEKMSRGAECIHRGMPFARGEEWRASRGHSNASKTNHHKPK